MEELPPTGGRLGHGVLCSQAVGKVSITLKTLGLWMFKEEQEANRTRENWVARKGSRDEGSR